MKHTKDAKEPKSRRKANNKMIRLLQTTFNDWKNVIEPIVGQHCKFVRDDVATSRKWGGYLYCKNKNKVGLVMKKLNIKFAPIEQLIK